MKSNISSKTGSFFNILVPISCVVASVFLIGFIFSVYVSTEYEKHNEQIRFINIVAGLTSVFNKNHKKLFSSKEQEYRLVSLDGPNFSFAADKISALILNQKKTFIVVYYNGKALYFFKGYDILQASELANSLNDDNLQKTLKLNQGDENLIGTSEFSTSPLGKFSIISSAHSSQFKIDFVFYKLWPYLLVAIALSLVISVISYRFVRARYDEVVRERTRFSDFAESSSDWFWEMDEKLRFSYFSNRFFQVTGVVPEKLLGLTREENGNPGTTAEDWEKQLSDLRERRSFKNFIHPRTKPNGDIVWLSVSGKPIFKKDRFIGFRGVGTDITERRKAEAEVIVSKENAEIANRAKSEFLANMSHELRTPLNAIIGFSDMLVHETFGPLGKSKNSESIDSIHIAGKHLLQIIGDILDISKIEAGEATVQETEINVRESVESCAAMVKARAKENEIRLVVDIPERFPYLYADERHVKQIIINLLSNAIKFTPDGGQVTIFAGLNNDLGMDVTVSDTGIGIAAEDIPKVLQPFGQVADSQSRGHEGTGLGLPICKSLMEMHDGSLDIESEVGKGTAVTIRFPVERIIQTQDQSHLVK